MFIGEAHVRPARFAVVVADLDLDATLLVGAGLFDGDAGAPISFRVVPRDQFGNVWARGPLDLQASIARAQLGCPPRTTI